MKKLTISTGLFIPLISLLCFISSLSFAQSTIRNGSCPRISEVFTTWETVSTSPNAGGGWAVPKYPFSGTTSGMAVAEEYKSCFTDITNSTNKNKNRIHCIYALENDSPKPTIRVTKDKPANYNCTCNSSTGSYSCVVR